VEGVVIERNVDMGQTVAASLQAPTLFTIAKDLKRMQVDADIDEADIGSVRVGQKATFTVDAFQDEEFEGRVEQVRLAPHTVQNVVTYTVVISADNQSRKLFPGMTANTKIVVASRQDTLKVPNGALRFNPEGRKEPGGESRAAGGGPSGPKERLKRLVQILELDEEQQSRVRAIFQGVRKKVLALRGQGGPPVDMQSRVQGFRQGAREEILAILTPGQREKFLQLGKRRDSSRGRRSRVWMEGPDGKPYPLEVIAGITDGSFTEIMKGDLEEGRKVILGMSRIPSKGSR
jgi:HlyD family secretion protein